MKPHVPRQHQGLAAGPRPDDAAHILFAAGHVVINFVCLKLLMPGLSQG